MLLHEDNEPTSQDAGEWVAAQLQPSLLQTPEGTTLRTELVAKSKQEGQK